ncbi:MAG: anthranilate phosphoribosyltransferase [Eubacterium sp.]
MINKAIEKLVENKDLTFEEAKICIEEIMSGNTSQMFIASYLTALRMKGETIDEISGSAAGMRQKAVKLEHNMDLLEIVGTGGDKANSFNISTTSALVIAAAGYPVAKHGNRGVSSKSGAADVLEALGVKITLEPERSAEILKEIGICFLFAQKYHTAMKYVAPVRKELGIRTVFNILGPLTNPAGANMNVIGVYSEDLVRPIAEVLMKLGVKKGMVIYGQDMLDEISLSAKTTVCEFGKGKTKTYVLNPEDYGFTLCSKDDLVGGNPDENARITREILSGSKGPKRDVVILNAAAGIYVASENLTYEQAIELAKETIDSGKAMEKLEQFIELSNK